MQVLSQSFVQGVGEKMAKNRKKLQKIAKKRQKRAFFVQKFTKKSIF